MPISLLNILQMNNHTVPTFGTGFLNKALVIAFAALGCLNARASLDFPVAEYGVGSWETKGHGNHRAVLEVKEASPVVKAVIPWRRRDANPEQKAILLFNENGERVRNLKILSLTGDQGELLFEAATPGKYYLYYLPYNPGVGNFDDPGTYFLPQETAAADWLSKVGSIAAPPEARLMQIQANGEFHRFDPMEVMPTKSEVRALAGKAGGFDYLLFPEDRGNSIRMPESVPAKWVASGPGDTFTGVVQPNEWYPWQIGVWAPEKELKNLKVEFSDFKNASGDVIGKSVLACFNTGGVDARGKDFTNAPSVPQGAVQPLWLMAEIPAKASGEYKGTVTITPENAPAQSVAVTLQVKGEPLPDHGVSDLWRLSRLHWLNSRIGLEETIVPPMRPMKRNGNQVELTCTGITFGADGLPTQVTAGGRKGLAAPVALKFLTADGNELKFKPETSLTRESDALQERRTAATGKDLSYTLSSRLDYSGGLNYELTVKADKPVNLRDMRLEVPVARDAASYLMGFAQRGGLRGGPVDWKWDDFARNYLWLGDATGGLQLKLTGANDNWDQSSLRPVGLPEGWYNGNKGGAFVREQDGAVMLCAYTGERTLEAGQELTFKFRLLLTPSKPVDADRAHWGNHYGGATSTIMHIHHSEKINPYINYPFFHINELKKTRNPEPRTEVTLKGSMEYLLPKTFDPVQGSVETDVKVVFDQAKTRPGDAGGNLQLLRLESAAGDTLSVYWNVDDKGLRSYFIRGKEQPVICFQYPTPDWKEGQVHRVGLSWTREGYALWVDGSLIGEHPMSGGPWHQGVDPVRVVLDSAGFAYGQLRVRNAPLTADIANAPALKDPATILLEAPGKAGSTIQEHGEVKQEGGFTTNVREVKTIRGQVNIDIYYTVRELANRAVELWALRSLGNEIFRRDTMLVYSVEKTEMAAAGGGDPWLREHLLTGYVPAWRQPLWNGETDAAIAITGLSRWHNYYLEGLDWLMKETGINGLYLDGIGYDEQIMARVAKVMLANNPDYRIKFHGGNGYDFEGAKANPLSNIMAHLPYITSLWMGEMFDYNRPPDYWLTEISGIPFGLHSEMLNNENGGNPYRGMVYGMSGRMSPSCTAIYRLWDEFGIADARLLGYWNPLCPVKTKNPNFRASAYVKEGKSLVAIAGWDPDYMLSTRATASMELSPDQSIRIDGVIDPKEWGKAAQLTNFKGFDTKAKVPSAGQTQAYMTFDSANLYFAFRCLGLTDHLLAKARERDSSVWEDDSVELFLQPDPARGDYYQLVVNSKGVLFDTKGINGGFWNGPWTVATSVAPDSWTCEGSIPLAALGLSAEQLGEGGTIGVNFVRDRKTPATLISTWSPSTGMLHTVENFGRLSVAKPGGRTVEAVKPDTVDLPPMVKVSFDWKALGLDPAKVKMTAPKLVNFQEGQDFAPGTTEFSIPKDKGIILLLESRRDAR
jgi:hypothetical protein